MTDPTVSLTALSEDQRVQADTRYMIIRPILEDGVTQAQVARNHNIPASTVRWWVKRYRERGRAGLANTAGQTRLAESKRYELALQAILQFAQTTLDYAKVEKSRDYLGLLSDVPRQIDATISLPDGRRIAVECKQWNREVDIEQVEAFDAKVRNDLSWDMRTPIMVVTAVDFTPAARNYAGKRNIQLAKLNHAATAEIYTLQLEGHTLIGNLDQLCPTSEIMVTQQWNSMDQLDAESSGTFTQQQVEL